MSYTVDAAIRAAKHLLTKFNSFATLAKDAANNESLYDKFEFAFSQIKIWYDEFSECCKAALVDETSPNWDNLCALALQIDQEYCDFGAVHVGIKRLQSSSLERPTSTDELGLNRSGSNQSLHSNCSNADHPRSNVRLPKISLPTFDGSLKDWPSFYELYKTLIHDNTSLSDIERFQYLISTLSKEPLQLVKHLPLIAENYATAFQALINRYQNQRLLATVYWQALSDADRISSDSFHQLRNLLNTYQENAIALDQFDSVDLWDFTLFNWLISKLDAHTRKQFELKFAQSDFPTYANLIQFLSDQCKALETASLGDSQSNQGSQRQVTNKSHCELKASRKTSQSLLSHDAVPARKPKCSHCKGDSHGLFACPTFLKLSPHKRYLFVKSSGLCFNCLSSTHSINSCASKHVCRYCSKSHNSLIHFADNTGASSLVKPTTSTQQDSEAESSGPTAVSMSTMTSSKDTSHAIVLATVLVEVKDKWGNQRTVRALCDSGSQSCFITDRCRKQLGLPISRAASSILGIGQTTVHNSQGRISCYIRPVGGSLDPLQINAIVLPAICNSLPSSAVRTPQAFENLKLADPHWNVPAPIDMLLDAQVFSQIIREGFIPGDKDRPAAVNTTFGWILFGNTSSEQNVPTQSFFVSADSDLQQTLKIYWEVEEVPANVPPSFEDSAAEKLFVETHTRGPTGRFGVCLPFKDKSRPHSFDGSLKIADRRLLLLERRLSSSPLLRELYHQFMQEYVSQGHMSKITSIPTQSESYFIPHHCVIKDTKIRVVFDASCQASNGLSLNDTLLAGPKLQDDIVSVLLRFRCHQFVFTCDVKQMFRNILIHDSDREYQLIRWRFSSHQPVDTYRLNTVTYGVKSSPYLAIRCLLQLAKEGALQFPLAAQAIHQNLYVDDFACGSDDLGGTLELREQLVGLLALGQFELRKWVASHPQLLEGIPPEHCQSGNITFDSHSDHTAKVLGVLWASSEDSFSFTVSPSSAPCTKRNILSEIARIYDPLGFLCPLNLWAKRLIQHLWSLGLDWDATPPKDVCEQWATYQTSISVLTQLSIPRGLKPPDYVHCQLHAFCDASEKGYACVVYFRFTDTVGNHHVSFVIAKSKVAPLKILSVPRLELCAAVLLAKLVAYVHSICQGQLKVDETFAWSDSQVVLCWIKSLPHKWKTFVANRITYIQERIAPSCWHHVPTKENPADPASRGLLPQDLLSCLLWWAGPSWLKDPPEFWPSSAIESQSEVEREAKPVALTTQVTISELEVLLDNHSSLAAVQRIVAYCRRFIARCRRNRTFPQALTENELHEALLLLVKVVQARTFHQEIADLQAQRACSKPLQKLNAFLDEHGVLRVGGRLSQASLAFEAKHPALLPRHHRLTELIITHTHVHNLHTGVNTTMYLLQQNFWVLSARRTVRHWISKCNRCFRTRPTAVIPPMGDLPPPRVSQLKAFSHVGVDYGGPIPVTLVRRRGSKTHKAYLCLFVCFSTKAIHVEVALDLSAETFIASLRRFISRRGRCSAIYSDCGTNFVGASKELNSYMQQAAEAELIEWHFNPPSAPHFGGLWESGIKSLKTHLYRVVGRQTLTYEELTTLCCQIEALLNSRPLCSLSSDPNDLSVLTPGHFLTMEPLTSAPDPDLSSINLSRLSRWQLVQRLHHDFWSRWKDEYLHCLHQRGKWYKAKHFDPLDVGTLVLIKDDQAPPLHWRLGRIVQLHPGRDSVARVATVRTATGTLKRPMIKLCPLPSQ